MGESQTHFSKSIYGIIAVMLVLQVITLGAAIKYGSESAQRDTTLLERADTMVQEMLPGIHKDLTGVSNTVTDIKGDVTLLRKQVDQVDHHVGQVGTAVSRVSGELEGMNQSMMAFFKDVSGLIWGHSLNPYVLMALLITILLSVPVFGAIYSRRRLREATVSDVAAVPATTLFAQRLHSLSQLIEQMREQQKSPQDASEMKRLMEETERLVREAQADLGHLLEDTDTQAKQASKSDRILH